MADKSSKGRRWLRERTPNDAKQGRRIRSLYRSFMAPLIADDPTHQAAALAAAELIVAAEDARRRLLEGDPAAESAVVRLENAARRAKLDLTALKPEPTSWWVKQQPQEAANGEE